VTGPTSCLSSLFLSLPFTGNFDWPVTRNMVRLPKGLTSTPVIGYFHCPVTGTTVGFPRGLMSTPFTGNSEWPVTGTVWICPLTKKLVQPITPFKISSEMCILRTTSFTFSGYRA
jgi:hypothetical protein